MDDVSEEKKYQWIRSLKKAELDDIFQISNFSLKKWDK